MDRNFKSKIKYWSDLDVTVKIRAKQNKDQLKIFKKTCLGYLVDAGVHLMFSQIIQHALVREVFQRDHEEMWFLFGETRVRFSLLDFCLISGMSWKGNEDLSKYNGIENQLVKKFFNDEVVTRSSIKRVYQNATFDFDEEAIRLSLAYLVFNYILAIVEDNFVDKALLNFICYGKMDAFPWGKIVFDMTKKSLSQALKGHVLKGEKGGLLYNFYKNDYCKLYKLNVMPYVFQIFLFETIPTLKNRGFCIDDLRSECRLLRWRELGKAPYYDRLNEQVFGSNMAEKAITALSCSGLLLGTQPIRYERL